MRDFFGMIVAALLDFKWLVLGVLFGALLAVSVIDARAAEAPRWDEPHCTMMAIVADVAVKMRDRGDPEDKAQAIVDKAMKDTPSDSIDYPSPEQLKILHNLVHMLYTHPEFKVEDTGEFVYMGCMRANAPDPAPTTPGHPPIAAPTTPAPPLPKPHKALPPDEQWTPFNPNPRIST